MSRVSWAALAAAIALALLSSACGCPSGTNSASGPLLTGAAVALGCGIVSRAAGFAASATLSSLPTLLREIPPSSRRCAPELQTTAMLTELSTVSQYFAVGVGPVDGSWRPVQQLYSDTELLDGIVHRVQARIDASERRVAASTLFLGFAARLWSIGLGAVAGYGLLPDLADLLFRETDGQIRLHLERPVAWQGDDLEPLLADMVLDAHLAPLAAALRRLGPISDKVLRGNTAAALLGAARVFGRESGRHLAYRLCSDERLSGAIRFDEDGYRRNSCCLYYRTPAGGLCGECVLSTRPDRRKDAS